MPTKSLSVVQICVATAQAGRWTIVNFGFGNLVTEKSLRMRRGDFAWASREFQSNVPQT
jgi:hypothetical protein